MLLIKQGTSFIFVISADAVCNRCFTARDAPECLRQVDAPAVNKINVNVSNSGFFGIWVFVPVVDGTLIIKRATEMLRPGRVNRVSVFLVFPKYTSWVSVNRRYLLLWQPALRELFLYCHDSAMSEEFIPWIESLLALLTMLTWAHQLSKPGPSWANVSRFYGTDVDTIVLPSNVRLPCMLPAPWISGQTLQGTWMSLMSRDCRSSFQQGEFGILPAFHGNDIPYCFWIFALFQS